MTRARASAYAAIVALAIVGLDQITKAIVEANLVIGERVGVIGPLELTNVGNTGIAFGLAGGGGPVIIALTFLALALILTIFLRDPLRPGMWVAVGLLLGGAVGNLIDRVSSEAVTDFIKLPMWPSFNLADIAITVGVLILAWVFLKEPGHEDLEPPAPVERG